jgi:hypothetical protein
MPDEVNITDSLEIGAGAFMERVDPNTLEFRPRIGLQRGIVEFSASLAYFHTAGTSEAWRAALEILYFKASNPFSSVRGNAKWPNWERLGPLLPRWNSAFLSRVTFYIAHELGHHCLKHTTGGGLELAGIRDSNGKPLKWQLGISSISTKDPVQSRALEGAADQWALEFMLENRYALGLDIDPEAFLSAVAELALLDAAKGRQHTEGNSNSWSHPVELARFHPVYATVSAANTNIGTLSLASYVRDLNLALVCIRQKSDPLDRLRQFIETGLICTNFSSTKPALEVFLAAAAPPLHNSRWLGSDVSIATLDAPNLKIIGRRSEDSPATGRTLAAENIDSRAGAAIWQVTLNNDQEYVFELRDAPKEGELAVRVGADLVGTATLKAGKLVKVKAYDPSVIAKVRNGNLVLNVASEEHIRSAEDL